MPGNQGERGQGAGQGRGRGRGQGRGRGRGKVTPLAEVLPSHSCMPPQSYPSTSTSRKYEEEYALVKKGEQGLKKNLKKLPSSARKEYTERKKKKQLERILLPDAPERKRPRNNSPERTPCRLMLGTPSTPPPPKPQPWQIAKPPAERILPECGSGAASPPAILPVCTSPEIRPTTPPPPKIKPQRESAAQGILPVCGPVSVLAASATPLSVSSSRRQSRPSINMGSQNAESTLTAWIDQQMVEELSDEEELEEFSLLNENFNYINTQPAHIPDGLNPDAVTWLAAEDAEADKILHDLVPSDYLEFDWKNDPNSFHGRREEFTGNPGPTFPVENLVPLEIFLKFFDDELLDLLVHETNKYSSFLLDRDYTTPNCRLTKWTNTDRCEMARFLSILIFQGLFPLTVESEYWKENGYLTLKYFGTIMKYNRFILLKRVFHLTSNSVTENLTGDDIKLRKIQPVLNSLQKKYSTLYLPSQNIAIDESLLKWHGRLSFSQKIATKAAKVGIKSYELCESSTGYLWSFFVYTGKGTNDQTRGGLSDKEPERDRQIDLIDLTGDLINRPTDATATSSGPPPPSNATARIVHELAKPLFNKGYTLIMDNFYNSPLLARYLKSQGTDVYGTIRLNREFVPEAMKSVSKQEMRTGEVMQSYCKDLSVMLWRDANIVSMISTFHQGEVGGKEKYGRYKFKPQVVLDYNKSMGGVDKKDQLLSAHPMERVRNHVWYKKIFRRLLNITVLNAYIIFKTNNPNITHRKFRTILAEQLARIGKPAEPMTELVTLSWRPHLGQTPRPKLSGNHFIGQGKSKRCVCVWCHKCRSKYICKQCNVTLCLDICFEQYHT